MFRNGATVWARVGHLVLAFLIATISVIAMPQRTTAAGSFVGRSGTRFTLNGNPFYVAGTNSHYLGWGSRAEVDDMLQNAKAMNANVVRTIMHSVIGSLDGSKPTNWNWQSTGDTSNMGMHGVYIIYWNPATGSYAFNDSTDTGLGRWDYVLQKAGQLGLKLNVALLDFWQWAGGVQQINSYYIPGYNMSGDGQRYTFFFQDARTKQLYKDWVSHVLNRTNTLTGIKYKDDPSVFAWDLMNEPEVSSVPLAQGWFQEMASYIKTIDANHLVTTGSEGFFGGQAGSDPTTEAINAPAIDFQTWHTYPDYHNYASSAATTGVNLINQHCQQAVANGRPVLLQEFAYANTHADQASVYQSWTNALYANNDCAGWLFWRLEGHVVPAPTGNFPAYDSTTPSVYPPDNGEHFSIYNNGSAAATVFKNAAAQMVAKNGPQPPTSTPTKTNTPAPPTSTPTNTATPTRTSTPVGGGGTNIAPSGTAYRWFSLYSATSDYQKSAANGLNDGNLATDVELAGGSDDNNNVYEGAGVVWATAQTVTSVKYYNGSCDQYSNGVFGGGVAVQFSTDGTTWTTSTWSVAPAYPANSCGASPSAAGQVYTFSGSAANVKGVRVVGLVRTANKPASWHAHATEVQIFN